ncbi:MAG: septal ring lytic transglycosylase RlpA family protein [Flavobacteriales bacterium]|jgi:rare lipoprotein A
MKVLFSIVLILSLANLAFAQGGDVQMGTASYYANKFEGRKTSSGQVFRQDSLTCAHKTLPFGTRIEVRNLSNDSLVVVTVNDRLPKSSSRVVDLTMRAARQLNFVKKGLTKVEIRVLGNKEEEVPTEENQH